MFYQLLNCKEYQTKYCLLDKEDYNYVNQSGIYTVKDINDGEEMGITVKCMQNIGFTELEIS